VRASSIRIAAVGDLQLGDSPVSVGFGLTSRYRSRGLDAAFSALRPLLAGADVVFGNLECTLSTVGLNAASWRSAQLRGEPGFARALARVGFTVVNVANNHAVQHGIATFHETVELLADVGIRCCGVRGGGPWCSQPVIFATPTGRRLGLLGYCQRPRQYGSKEPPFAEGTPAEILSDVERLSRTVDDLMVSLHWGEEFVSQPSRAEVALAHAVIDAGAALLVGHHPHVLRPVERYGRGLIAYSLGNCVADMVWWRALRRGGVLRCSVDASGAGSAELTPLYIDARYRPRPAARVAGNRLRPLEEPDYRLAVRRALRRQRAAAYRHAAFNVWRFPPRILGQLAVTTIQNKLGALRNWLRRAG
jgi:poly-gamma-glutamate capsule biosynthesis protein CapA/YwtB (metallophosphatase superfamily)